MPSRGAGSLASGDGRWPGYAGLRGAWCANRSTGIHILVIFASIAMESFTEKIRIGEL